MTTDAENRAVLIKHGVACTLDGIVAELRYKAQWGDWYVRLTDAANTTSMWYWYSGTQWKACPNGPL
jgi:hypothetical protein